MRDVPSACDGVLLKPPREYHAWDGPLAVQVLRREYCAKRAKDHLEQCPELELNCQECQESMKRKQLDAHKATCPMVEVLCKWGISFKRKDKKEHGDLTYSVTEVPCPLKCGQNITW